MEKAWEKFIKSGRVGDYLQFVDKRREEEIREGSRESLYNRGFGNQGDERRGE